jgi:RNA polymerase sigma-70 factor (ECF subfamily)
LRGATLRETVHSPFMPDEAGECTFPVTPWSLVARAGHHSANTMRQALDVLLQRYLPALRAHLIHHRRLAADFADDLLQSFVSQKVLEQRLIARSDRTRGRFRSFLLTALNNFLIDELRRQRARGGGGATAQLGEMEQDMLAADDEAPSIEFDRAWAQEALAEAVRRMRWECERSRRPDLWGVFDGRVLSPAMENLEPESYESLVARFDLQSPTQASNVLMTGKRMFARNLRGVLAESAEDDAEVEEDLRDLRAIISESSFRGE